MNVIQMIEDLLFPRRCPVCLDVVSPPGAWVCDVCRDKLRPVVQPCCMRCGRQLDKRDVVQEFCGNCREKRRSFEAGVVGWDYGSVPVRRMISEVKYRNKRQLLDYPCRDMAERTKRRIGIWQAECLVPVPLHRSRRRKRGFNQAEEIADRLSAVWEIPVEKHLLFRKKKTAPQKELGESGRLENLVSAFEADAGCAKQYRSVILVDDILTTGATMEACARALKHAGIEHVYMAALSAGAGPQMSGTRRERHFR